MTTASYRRRQRRIRQQQYQAEADTSTDIESNYDENMNDITPLIYNNVNNNKKKPSNNRTRKKNQRIYLEPSRILRYMQDNAFNIISARGNQAYVLAASPIYHEWVRNNYELQVWQNYLKMGMQDKHWSKKIVQRTKKRDDTINSRFVQRKISRLTTNIAQANAIISKLQIELATYWSQTTAGTTLCTATSSAVTGNTNRIRYSLDRLEKVILKYIQHCTQHIKTMSEDKIKLANAQL